MRGRKTKERMTTIGKTLTEKRLQVGLSQQQVADAAGMSLKVYQRLENGEMSFGDVRLKYGLMICSTLHLDPFYLAFPAE